MFEEVESKFQEGEVMELINWATGKRTKIREKQYVTRPTPQLSFEEMAMQIMKDCIECTATDGKIILTKMQVK